jgi:succinate dehydrogenase/fumarate reductase flavoprotein subunit
MTDAMDVDLLVVGGGMAGMVAARRAAELGEVVLVVEKGPALGGSAVISGGFVWTASTLADAQLHCPAADPDLLKVVVERYEELIDLIGRSGASVEPEQDVMFGRGRRVDMIEFVHRSQRAVEAGGGAVVTSASVVSLTSQQDVVQGARVRDVSGCFEVNARRTVLATGGFQGNRGLLESYFGPAAARLMLRSNPYSTGDGLLLGLGQGASTTDRMDTFYGHLITGPLRQFTRPEFVRFAALFSHLGALLNVAGERFTDESDGDHVSAQAVARQNEGRAILVLDDPARESLRDRSFVPGLEAFDVVTETEAIGGRYMRARSPAELARAVGPWGFSSCNVERTIEALSRSRSLTPPFHVLEVRPGITFTQGGLRIDDKCRVLDDVGFPIRGLYAAGADAGGAFNGGYAGGLAMAGTLGFTAATHQEVSA